MARRMNKRRWPVHEYQRSLATGTCRFCGEVNKHQLTCNNNKRLGAPMNELQKAASQHNWRKMMIASARTQLQLVTHGLDTKLPPLVESYLKDLEGLNKCNYDCKKQAILEARKQK